MALKALCLADLLIERPRINVGFVRENLRPGRHLPDPDVDAVLLGPEQTTEVRRWPAL